MPAYTMLKFDGSAATSEQAVSGSTNNTFFHVLPPSVVLKTPRSSFGPHSRPSPHTYTLSGFFGSTTMRAILSLLSRPILVQCSPASSDLYMPSPIDALFRGFSSPVPTYT